MKIEVDKLLPNPFRNLKHYPIRRDKVDALKASIKSTDFWDNLVARPNGKGYEIAYGHHRLEALKESNIEVIDIPIRPLDDATMLCMMASENMAEWGASAEIEQETIRAVVQAFADGKIELPKVSLRGKHDESGANSYRIAPSFKSLRRLDDRSSSGKIYTAVTIAKFIGWPRWKVQDALLALELNEGGAGIDFAGLNTSQATVVAREFRHVKAKLKDDKLATEIGSQLAEDFRATQGLTRGAPGKFSTKNARGRTEELLAEREISDLSEESRDEVKQVKAKRNKEELERHNRQVKDFLDWAKEAVEPVKLARRSVSKFSPEAKRFAVRRINVVLKELTALRESLAK